MCVRKTQREREKERDRGWRVECKVEYGWREWGGEYAETTMTTAASAFSARASDWL